MSFSSSSCYSEMFPSTKNGNVDPINYHCPIFTDFTSSNQHLLFDQSNFVNFPSPFTPCYDDFFPGQNGEFLAHQEQQPLKEIQENFMVVNMAESEHKKEDGKMVMKKNKCSKRDRHSKINTAQGPRDRRMRLSLKVARDFFDLQDKLRFDKASKTVEWLLLQASSAIKLKSRIRSVHAYSPCECEIISRIVEEDKAAAAIKDTAPKAAKASLPCTRVQKKAKKAKPSRKTAFRPDAKELRKKARAKARQRTLEKQRRNKIELLQEKEANQINHFSSSSEAGEDSVTQTHSFNPFVADATSHLAADDSLAAIGKWSPFSSLTHLYNPEFPQQQNEITDFQTMLWD